MLNDTDNKKKKKLSNNKQKTTSGLVIIKDGNYSINFSEFQRQLPQIKFNKTKRTYTTS